MRPFFDQPIQLGPATKFSLRRSIRTTLAGSSALYDFATLQTRRSPSWVCTASMSDFCREDDACQESVTMGDGPLDVVKLCRMVKRGWRVAINREPF